MQFGLKLKKKVKIQTKFIIYHIYKNSRSFEKLATIVFVGNMEVHFIN